MRRINQPAPLRISRWEMNEQDKEWRAGPEREPELERVWVVYFWDRKDRWSLAGFLKRRKRRRPQTMNRFFARARRKLHLQKHTELKIVSLAHAQHAMHHDRQAFLFTPPARYETTRPTEALTQKVEHAPKGKKFIVRQRAIRFHKKRTEFFVLGRRPGDREDGYLFLGPLTATTVKAARVEADELHGAIYTERLVLRTKDASKRLRGAMHRGSVTPGVDRVLWPEPMPLKRMLELSVTQLGMISKRDALLHWRAAEKQARKAIKREQKKETAYWLAVMTFLAAWDDDHQLVVRAA